MIFHLQDSKTSYFVREDFFGGYTLTANRREAMIFDNDIAENRETVKKIYKAFAQHVPERKVSLLVFPLNKKYNPRTRPPFRRRENLREQQGAAYHGGPTQEDHDFDDRI